MIHLVLGTNENYADGMLVTVASALCSLNREAKITIHLLDGGISEKTFQKLDRISRTHHPSCSLDIIKIQEQSFHAFTPGPGNSLMTYARLLMGSLLIGIDRVIYIDVDFLVFKDLQELWRMDMQGKIAWACQDITIPYLDGETPLPVSEEEKQWPYFNAGFLMIDLKKWRETNIEKKSLELGLINKSGLADQSILNYLFRGDVGFLDAEWNWQSPNVLLDGRVRIANYHFIWVKKPWMHFRTTLNYRLWRYYYRTYAAGSMSSLYRKIGLKRLIIGLREYLIRSSPFLCSLYFKSLAWKLGAAIPQDSGLRKYYYESSAVYPIDREKVAFDRFVKARNPIQ
jgi:lipopolysaccharide biosynthesis glycosyltransferase